MSHRTVLIWILLIIDIIVIINSFFDKFSLSRILDTRTIDSTYRYRTGIAIQYSHTINNNIDM